MDGKLYDKAGIQIMVGDVLKVFHFVGARRKRHYMYKQVISAVPLGKENPKLYLKISHLDLDKSDPYHERLDGRRLTDYEILQGKGLEDRQPTPEDRR
jgi:hypothetical protein